MMKLLHFFPNVPVLVLDPAIRPSPSFITSDQVSDRWDPRWNEQAQKMPIIFLLKLPCILSKLIKSEPTSLETANILQYSITDGVIEFGKEGEVLPLLTYIDVSPLEIKYFSFAAWTGVEAKFLYDCPIPGGNGTECKCYEFFSLYWRLVSNFWDLVVVEFFGI